MDIEKVRLVHANKIVIDTNDLIVLDGIDFNGEALTEADSFFVVDLSRKNVRVVSKEYMSIVISEKVFHGK